MRVRRILPTAVALVGILVTTAGCSSGEGSTAATTVESSVPATATEAPSERAVVEAAHGGRHRYDQTVEEFDCGSSLEDTVVEIDIEFSDDEVVVTPVDTPTGLRRYYRESATTFRDPFGTEGDEPEGSESVDTEGVLEFTDTAFVQTTTLESGDRCLRYTRTLVED